MKSIKKAFSTTVSRSNKSTIWLILLGVGALFIIFYYLLGKKFGIREGAETNKTVSNSITTDGSLDDSSGEIDQEPVDMPELSQNLPMMTAGSLNDSSGKIVSEPIMTGGSMVDSTDKTVSNSIMTDKSISSTGTVKRLTNGAIANGSAKTSSEYKNGSYSSPVSFNKDPIADFGSKVEKTLTDFDDNMENINENLARIARNTENANNMNQALLDRLLERPRVRPRKNDSKIRKGKSPTTRSK